MNDIGVPRRDFLVHGGAALAGIALASTSFSARAFPVRSGEEVIPWADQPPPHARPQIVPKQLRWEEFDSLLAPNDRFFLVGRYGFPAIARQTWTLNVTGRVRHSLTLTLDQIKARPRREVVYTMDCSGNHRAALSGLPPSLSWLDAAMPSSPPTEACGANVANP